MGLIAKWMGQRLSRTSFFEQNMLSESLTAFCGSEEREIIEIFQVSYTNIKMHC